MLGRRSVRADRSRPGPVAKKRRRARARRGGRRADPRSARHGQDHRGGRVRAAGAAQRAPGPVLRRVQRCCGHARRALTAERFRGRRFRKRREFRSRTRRVRVVVEERRRVCLGPAPAREELFSDRKIKNENAGKEPSRRATRHRNPDPTRAPRAFAALRARRVAGGCGRAVGRQRARAGLRARVRGPAPAAGEADVARAPRRARRRAA